MSESGKKCSSLELSSVQDDGKSLALPETEDGGDLADGKSLALLSETEDAADLMSDGKSLALPEKEGGANFLNNRRSNDRRSTFGAGYRVSMESVILTPDKKLMATLIRALELSEGLSHVTNQLFPVYLVTIVGWTPLLIRALLRSIQ